MLRIQDRSRRTEGIICISVYYAAVQGSFTTEAFHLSQKSSSNLSVPEHKQSYFSQLRCLVPEAANSIHASIQKTQILVQQINCGM